MPGPMEGVRVVELGVFVVGPSAAAVLADWGADVIKIESPDGDPNRAWTTDCNPAFELDNRGKLSVMLDLKNPAGLAIAHELLADADVFVTNLRPGALESLGLDHDAIVARYPRLVYASITGYGLNGPDQGRASYDGGAFWSRAGVLAAMTPAGAEFPQPPGGGGDHVTSMTAVAGIAAALVARQRTGQGQHVTTSLFRAGIFMMGFDVNMALAPRRGGPAAIEARGAQPVVQLLPCEGRAMAVPACASSRIDTGLSVARALGLSEMLEDRAVRHTRGARPQQPGADPPPRRAVCHPDPPRLATCVGRRGRVVDADPVPVRSDRRLPGRGGRSVRRRPGVRRHGSDGRNAGRLLGDALGGSAADTRGGRAHRGGAARPRSRLGRHRPVASRRRIRLTA